MALLALVFGVATMAPAVTLAEPEGTLTLRRYEAAQRMVEAGQVDAARMIARVLVVEHPKWGQAWNLLGVTYAASENTFNQADEAFYQAALWDKENPEPLRNRGLLKQRQGKNDKAAELLLKAAEMDESDVPLQVATARALVAVNRITEAKQRYQLVLAEDPRNLFALTGVGALLVSLGEYSEAIALYERAVEAGEESALLFINITDALVRAGRFEEALRFAEQGLTHAKSDFQIWNNKIRALLGLERFVEAEEESRRAVGEQGRGMAQGVSNYLLGIALSMQGCSKAQAPACLQPQPPECCAKDSEALTRFEEALATAPEIRDLQIRLALAHFAVGSFEDAEYVLREYIAAQGERVEAEAFGALAVVLHGFGEPRDVEDALRLYREARETAPDFDSEERLRTFRQWPKHPIEVISALRQLDADARAEQKRSRKGCGCGVAERGQLATWWMMLVAFLGGGYLIRRRRRYD